MKTFSQVLNLLPGKGYDNELKINFAEANFDGSENYYNPE